jgi:hypothetical protein
VTAVARETSGYRTLSSRAVLGPTLAGGVLAIAGGLGVWVRAVQTSAGANEPAQVGRVLGASHVLGWVVAALGLAAALASAWWNRRDWRSFVPGAIAVAAVIVIAMQLRWASATSTSMADAVRADAGVAFSAYHAGFGWGAWTMGIAAVLLGIGVVAGAMRLVDVRMGSAS